MGSMHNHESLNEACRRLFGDEVTVGERAARIILQSQHTVPLFGESISTRDDLDVFRSILTESPACADIAARNQIDLQMFGASSADTVEPYTLELANFDWLLSTLFADGIFNTLTETGTHIRDSGILTEIDLFIGCLEGGRADLHPSRTVERILKPLGLMDDGYALPASDEFLSNIESQCRSIGVVDPSHSNQQFVLFLDDRGQFRIRRFGATVIGRIETPQMPSGPFLFRGGTIQPFSPAGDFSLDVLAQLEELINNPRAAEHDFQHFFEEHPQLLTALDFNAAHAHPILYHDDGSKLIPDFFLERLDSGSSAILDLKKPEMQLAIRKRNRTYFSQFVQEAIAQLQYYREWFENPRNRDQFEDRLRIKGSTFRPKLVLVGGRTSGFRDEIERIRLISNQHRDLELWTYDDVLDRARRYHAFVSRSRQR